jgi:hypothetical protein
MFCFDSLINDVWSVNEITRMYYNAKVLTSLGTQTSANLL